MGAENAGLENAGAITNEKLVEKQYGYYPNKPY